MRASRTVRRIRRVVVVAAVATALTGCGRQDYGGDTQNEAQDVAVAAVANRCGAPASDAVLLNSAESTYASNKAWLFTYRLHDHQLQVWAWYDAERNRDLSVVEGHC